MTSKTEVQNTINSFFEKKRFTKDEVRKIRNLAMKHRIRLGRYRRLFCKACLSQLKGSIRLSKGYKTIICEVCGKNNRVKTKKTFSFRGFRNKVSDSSKNS